MSLGLFTEVRAFECLQFWLSRLRGLESGTLKLQMMFQENLAIVGISHWDIQETGLFIIRPFCIIEAIHLVFLPQYNGTTKTYFSDKHTCHHLLLSNKSTDESGSCGSGMCVAEDWEWEKTNAFCLCLAPCLPFALMAGMWYWEERKKPLHCTVRSKGQCCCEE